jgi:hypothetical protein
MMIIGAAMLVILTMSRVRDPKFWSFMGFEPQGVAGGPPLTEAEIADEDVDTHLRPKAAPVDSHIRGTIRTTDRPSDTKTSQNGASQNSGGDVLHRSRKDAWTQMLDKLSGADNTQLRKVLKLVRSRQQVPAAEQQDWPRVVEQLETLWKSFYADAFTAVTQMGNDEQATWLPVLKQLESAWSDELAALQAAGDGQTLDAQQRQTLDTLQQLLDEVALDKIEDNTVHRLSESDAWFRFLEILAESELPQLQHASTGPVGFLQLYKQPDFYRGKLVTVRGEANLVYHVHAPKNIYGISEYYIFWMRPAGGPDSPIVVYSLEVPPDFPDITKTSPGKQRGEVREEVEFTGYFFKNYAYRAKDGTRIAPLVLAKVPRWQPPAVDLNTTGQLPSVPVAVFAFLALAVVATLIAVVVYKFGRGSSAEQFGIMSDAKLRRLKSLKDDELSPNVDESLRRLASTQDGPTESEK